MIIIMTEIKGKSTALLGESMHTTLKQWHSAPAVIIREVPKTLYCWLSCNRRPFCLMWHLLIRDYKHPSKWVLIIWLPLYDSMNQQLFEKNIYNQKIATMKTMDDFCCEWKPSCVYYKSTLFSVSKNEWDTNKGTGKSMKNALYVQQHGKRHHLDWSNVKNKNIKSVHLAIVELC